MIACVRVNLSVCVGLRCVLQCSITVCFNVYASLSNESGATFYVSLGKHVSRMYSP